VSKRGLPAGVQMRHDFHYVEELNIANRPVGKIIRIDQIEPNPEQPRTEIGDLTDLANSIREKGVLEPLLVKPTGNGRFMIIAGERRWRASSLAGLEEVPCIELDIDENGVAEIALIENLQRKDLTIWEEADGLKSLAGRFGYTQDQIAKKISKSRTTVTELMTIAGIPDAIREKCHARNIAAKSTLLEIARQFDDAAMLKLVDTLGNGTLDRDAVRKAARADRAISTPSELAEKKVFRYSPADPRCTIEIKFNDPASMNRTSILKALKDAFEAVKKDEAEAAVSAAD
jgi:ParB family chromosome partitioning protein